MTESELAEVADALGRVPSGLFILTARHGRRDGRAGLLGATVRLRAAASDRVRAQGRDVLAWLGDGAAVTVNVVGEGQKKFLSHFGKGFGLDEDAFAGLGVARREGEAPVLTEAPAPALPRRRSRQQRRSRGAHRHGRRRPAAPRRRADGRAQERAAVLRGYPGRVVCTKLPMPPMHDLAELDRRRPHRLARLAFGQPRHLHRRLAGLLQEGRGRPPSATTRPSMSASVSAGSTARSTPSTPTATSNSSRHASRGAVVEGEQGQDRTSDRGGVDDTRRPREDRRREGRWLVGTRWTPSRR